MQMTMTQKILAACAGRASVSAGELITVSPSLVLGNDVTAPVAIAAYAEMGNPPLYDPQRVSLVMDHFTPNKDIKAAENCRTCRTFAAHHGITHFYEGANGGVEHVLLPQQGLVTAGDVVIGADSHTCTYGALGAFSTGVGSTDIACAMATGKAWLRVPQAIRFVLTGKPKKWVGGKDIMLHIIGKIGVDGALYQSMEFTGDALQHLPMHGRFTMANMAVEAGAKNGIFPVDAVTLAYLQQVGAKEPAVFCADADAEYAQTITVDVSSLEPTVAFPHLPENTKTFGEIGDVPIDQVVIGSCTNGRLADLQEAAAVLRGRQAAPGVRLLVIPATQAVYLQALEEGLLAIFAKAGAQISAPTCGPCLGGHMGILAAGERAVATTNRNFVGRMGSSASEVYLASPAVAAASAVAGKLAHPDTL